jgi:UDP-N-acetylglucosamine--N-acetylmuramyl-(pentapeptide) pyrophosphoryl-undecaprenol N-acetylglucosamine transferase
LRILLTGGGTGGHIYPILAVAEELQMIVGQAKLDLRYFGAPGPYQNLLETNGIKVSKIFSAKLRRYFDFRNFIDIPILLPLSIVQTFWRVFWFMPDVLFSKGGPSSLPVVLACKFYRIPIIIHDSDSIVGLANQIAIRFADRIAVSFKAAINFLLEKYPKKREKLSGKITLVGNPIRRSLISADILDSATAKKNFGFNPEKPVILVIGGSQGAVKINDFMLEIAEELIKNYQVLHQTGVKNFEGFKNELNIIFKNYSEEEKTRYKIVAYFEKDLKDAYSAADLIISRASSGSIFENATFAKPSILIPLPSEVVGNHQISNAYEYAKTAAAIVIEEPNLKHNIFLAQLKKLFSEPRNSTELSLRGEPETLKQMSEAAKKFSKPEAARVIAEEILKLASPVTLGR